MCFLHHFIVKQFKMSNTMIFKFQDGMSRLFHLQRHGNIAIKISSYFHRFQKQE
jgi:hypothetical protein